MKKISNTVYAGVLTGFVLGILMPVISFSTFITGDTVVEFIEDGGNLFLVIAYYILLGLIVGCIVALIINKISVSQNR